MIEENWEIIEGEIPEGYEPIIPNCRIIPKPIVGARTAKKMLEADGTKVILVRYRNGYCSWALKKV